MILIGGILLIAAVIVAGLAPGSNGLLVALMFCLNGIGWNFAFVSGSALLTDALEPAERTSMQGFADLMTGLMGALGSTLGGIVLQSWGFADAERGRRGADPRAAGGRLARTGGAGASAARALGGRRVVGLTFSPTFALVGRGRARLGLLVEPAPVHGLEELTHGQLEAREHVVEVDPVVTLKYVEWLVWPECEH